jgi:hypothetical protein
MKEIFNLCIYVKGSSVMALEGIAFRTARSFLRNYHDEFTDWKTAHEEAMDCWDCQNFLQLGIDAFHWINRTDQEMRKAVYAGKKDYSQEDALFLEKLYAEWLEPCLFAERWIAAQQSRGFSIDNLEEFRKCCEEVRAIVEELNGTLSNPQFAAAQAAAVEAYRKGNTFEFWEAE